MKAKDKQEMSGYCKPAKKKVNTMYNYKYKAGMYQVRGCIMSPDEFFELFEIVRLGE